MNKSRLEAFSDGVFAIIITIMVLELKIPHGSDWTSLEHLIPVFIGYVMSFMYVGIYWGNHHHLLHTVHKVNSLIMISNLNLLFWLSLIPFCTGYMGENHFEPFPVALYAGLLLICGGSYNWLSMVIEKSYQPDSKLRTALKMGKKKGYISLAAYISAIPLAYINTTISGAIFVMVAIMWFIPDKNIEAALKD